MQELENDIEITAPAAEQPRRQAEAATIIPTARPDRHIWGIYILLCMVSVVELFSASSREVTASGMLGIYGPIVRHGVMLLAGLGIILMLQRVHYRNFIPIIPLFALLSVVMMLCAMFFGTAVNGAHRSISIVGITVQPSEFLKLSAAAMIALIMSRCQIRGGVRKEGVWATCGVVCLFAVLLLPQGLTNTLLLLGISLSMMLVSGVSIKKMVLWCLALIALVAIIFALHLLLKEMGYGGILGRFDTWIERITAHSGSGIPKYEQALTSDNAQEMYSYMAQAHGGITGVMPGNSREVARLPLAFSDYIFAIIVEDLGLIGGLAVIVTYLWLLGRASAIASQCSRAFPAFMVIGMALVIVLQAIFHIAIVVGLAPVSGQPLPLISKGGTSILITSIAFGVMLSISRFAVRNGRSSDIRLEKEMLSEDDRADNPSQLK